MPITDQNTLALQMVSQIRVLDPSISAEIGTPERKIIDTFAQALAENSVDINRLSGALDLATLYGSDLDNFVAMFGFGRQIGSVSTGFVTFSRLTASAYDITIPALTQVMANITVTPSDPTVEPSITSVTFQTTDAVTLVAGQTQVVAPIQALFSGDAGNVAPGNITQFANLGAPPLGITEVTNEIATTGGSNPETDSELKVRFKNTIFRNVSGTEDQYLALAMATQFSTKANVVGPISRYREYIQVPLVDDSSVELGPVSIVAATTNGSNQLTSISTPPDGVSILVGMQIVCNSQPTALPDETTIIAISGDGLTWTLSTNFTGTGGSADHFTVYTGNPTTGPGNGLGNRWTTVPSANPYIKRIYLNVPNFVSNGTSDSTAVFYRQDTDFTLNLPPRDVGDTYRESQIGTIPSPAQTPNNPNITFYNVYTGSNANVTLPRPGNILLLEYSYMSQESRNDFTRNISNCVDVFVDGTNALNGTAVVPPPGDLRTIFNKNPIDPFYYLKFRRTGEPQQPPTRGNLFTGLFFEPTIGLPNQIVVGNNTYLLGTHYFSVEDITLLRGTVRARNGIEWVVGLKGKAPANPNAGPFTGQPITTTGATSITIPGYTYDKNIIDLQVSLEGAKQVTTDVLAHRAVTRYFKFDLTIVYAAGVGINATNAAIEAALTQFLSTQYFGAVVQLSDILLTVRSTTGVQNVRWSADLSFGTSPAPEKAKTIFGAPLHHIVECDIKGVPLVNPDPYTGDTTIFESDFYLRDSQLPALPNGQTLGDTLPGLILRPRAEGTFSFF